MGAAANWTMRRVRGFSIGLAARIEALPDCMLPGIAMRVLSLVRAEHSDVYEICDAIDRFQRGAFPDLNVTDRLKRASAVCDETYATLEAAGKSVESQKFYSRMCIFDALAWLFADGPITHDVIDNVLYDLTGGAPRLAEFVCELERVVRDPPAD